MNLVSAVVSAEGFAELVEATVLSALCTGTVPDFATLVRAVGSAYPSDILSAVDRLAERGIVTDDFAASMRDSSRTECPEPKDVSHPIRLPPPHPLDYDWRFEEPAVDYLLERAGQSSAALLIALGAPSVFRRGLETMAAERVLLLDADPSLASAFRDQRHRLLICDLLKDELPRLSADAIIADPPWYPAHVRAFLWAARQMVAPDGEVMLTMPQPATRPGVAHESAELLEWAAAAGLRRAEELPAALLYRTPPFERAALRAEGIHCPTGSWRRGDLWIFVPDGEVKVPRPIEPIASGWSEVNWDGVRIRFRTVPSRHSHPGSDPSPTSLVQGDVLPSVSRRHPLRSRVDVWTSGNRVFGCANPPLLAQIAGAASRMDDPRRSAEIFLGRPLTCEEQRKVAQAVETLGAVVRVEKAEYADTYDL